MGDLCQAELAEAPLLGGLPRLLLCQVALLVLLKKLAEPVQVDVVPVFEAVNDNETALERAVGTVRYGIFQDVVQALDVVLPERLGEQVFR